MTERRISIKGRVAALLVAAAFRLAAQDASTVMDRYVQVTGGARLYKKYNLLRVYSTVTHANKSRDHVSYAHTRPGNTYTETDSGSKIYDAGVNDGVAWRFTEDQGAQILSGKEAARALAESSGFDEDEWRIRYPRAVLLPDRSIKGVVCRHVSLTRTDGSQVERFYDASSGFLMRELASKSDGRGVEQPTATDLEAYGYFAGIRRPTVLHVKSAVDVTEIHIDNVSYSGPVSLSDLELPREVVRAIMSARDKPGSLPSPADLLYRYLEATGGKAAYDAVKSEVVSAEVTYSGDRGKFSLMSYVAGQKAYSSCEIPSLGKFESGDDGELAWEKPVTTGPRVTSHDTRIRLLGPDPSEVIRWWEAALDMQTVSKDRVAGAACYQVRLGPASQNPPSACFDAESGLLVAFRSGGGDPKSAQLFSNYKKVNGLAICHRIQTRVAGHAAVIEVKNIAINVPIPPRTFYLPPEIQILKTRRLAAAKANAAGATAGAAPARRRATNPQ